MIDISKKCSFKEHKDIDAVSYCQNCKTHICNKRKNHHQGSSENHHSNNPDNNKESFIETPQISQQKNKKQSKNFQKNILLSISKFINRIHINPQKPPKNTLIPERDKTLLLLMHAKKKIILTSQNFIVKIIINYVVQIV